MNNEERKLKSLVAEDVWELMKLCDVIIAGGAITSIHTGKDVNDMDVYFRSPEQFMAFVYAAFGQSDIDLEEFALIANFVTNRSLLLRDKRTQQDVQLIFDRFYPTVQDVFNAFDFTINMGAYEFKDGGQFVLDPNFMKHNSQRYLSFNKGTSYPLMSALRVAKYVERGYTISKPQMLRVLLAVNDKQINNWSSLLKEVGGMYGLDMSKVFPTEEGFSMEKAMECLDNIQADNKRSGPMGVTLEDVYEKVKFYFEDDREQSEEKISPKGHYFKNARLIDGVASSNYLPTFKYVKGEVVEGGEKGIWVYEGEDVVEGQYWNGGSVVVELEPIHSCSVLNGRLFVPAVVKEIYTQSEFLSKFSVTLNPWQRPFCIPSEVVVRLEEILYAEE